MSENKYIYSLEELINSLQDAVYVVDKNGNTLEITPNCAKLLGVKSKDLLGKNVRELETDGIFNPSVSTKVLHEKKKITSLQKTKEDKLLLTTGIPIFSEDGSIAQVIDIAREVTKLEEIKKEINEMKDTLLNYEKSLQDKEVTKEKVPHNFVFRSKKMEEIMELIKRISVVDSTVMITGETGVGKDVIAKMIHYYSSRANHPFVKINCGAIPENLLEAELFGHEKGAFSGAVNAKEGLFETANKGILFLDEILELCPRLQVKLLHVLQEKQFNRIGGRKPINVDVRIIAATNRNLKEEISQGNFREDLYYRLNVIPLFIPPLRERKEDLTDLIFHFLEVFNKKYSKNTSFKPELIELFLSYDWPGNIRELQNTIEQLVVMASKEEIGTEKLPEHLSEFKNTKNFKNNQIKINDIVPLYDAIDYVEKEIIYKAYKKYKKTTKIAEVLGVDQSTVSRKLKKILYE